MASAPSPRLKICCISSRDEARLAIDAGADALGLVSSMPSGPGVIDEDLIADIAGMVPRPIDTFLLTCLTRADAIAAQHARCGTTTIQLVDGLPQPELRRLRDLVPGVALVQVIHVRGDDARHEADAVAPFVDALLLDSGNPFARVKEFGGTGRVHDWLVSAQIVSSSAVPVYLAGGLTPDNVGAAMSTVNPYGLDLCSGVRENGQLSARRLRAFVRAARGLGV